MNHLSTPDTMPTGTPPGARTRRPRTLGTLGATAALALVLAACGGGAGTGAGHGEHSPTASSSAPAPTDSGDGGTAAGHNADDVTFAQDMIVHHEGAVEMASLAAGRSQNPQVKDLAQKIVEAQGPEIEQMTTWLESWGEPVEAAGEHAGHGGMPGMMTEEQLTALEDASGEEFDRLFLEGMIQHHRGAIEMAEIEKSEGADADAKALAETIGADQTAEIEQMQQMLQDL